MSDINNPHGPAQWTEGDVARLRASHDALLAAARGAVKEFIWCESDHNLAELRAAIANAEKLP